MTRSEALAALRAMKALEELEAELAPFAAVGRLAHFCERNRAALLLATGLVCAASVAGYYSGKRAIRREGW